VRQQGSGPGMYWSGVEGRRGHRGLGTRVIKGTRRSAVPYRRTKSRKRGLSMRGRSGKEGLWAACARRDMQNCAAAHYHVSGARVPIPIRLEVVPPVGSARSPSRRDALSVQPTLVVSAPRVLSSRAAPRPSRPGPVTSFTLPSRPSPTAPLTWTMNPSSRMSANNCLYDDQSYSRGRTPSTIPQYTSTHMPLIPSARSALRPERSACSMVRG
jgi:hypothetical protein